jgi:hypothetical protein
MRGGHAELIIYRSINVCLRGSIAGHGDMHCVVVLGTRGNYPL